MCQRHAQASLLLGVMLCSGAAWFVFLYLRGSFVPGSLFGRLFWGSVNQ